MKATKKVVVVTLELTEDEAQVLYDVAGQVFGEGPARAVFDRLYAALGNLGFDYKGTPLSATEHGGNVWAHSEYKLPK